MAAHGSPQPKLVWLLETSWIVTLQLERKLGAKQINGRTLIWKITWNPVTKYGDLNERPPGSKEATEGLARGRTSYCL